MAIRHGASAIGLVSAMPSGPGPIPEDLIAEIAAQVPPPIATFLLTSRQDAASVIDQQRRTRANTLQIADTLAIPELHHLRHALPGIRLAQVIRVEGPESLEEAKAVAPHVDAILLDSGRLRAAVKELGGTGRVHDWSVSARIRETAPVTIFLAGGLNPENVRGVIEQIGPFGVDVCTGVRTNGSLDEAKLSAFFQAVRSAKPSGSQNRETQTRTPELVREFRCVPPDLRGIFPRYRLDQPLRPSSRVERCY